MWDSQVSILNSSYLKTRELLSAGKTKEAYEEFHVNFLQAVKKIYSEASATYPTRFNKVENWCSWVKELYVNSGKADKALANAQIEEAHKLLAALREEFFNLHKEAGIAQANDVVYAIRTEAAKDKPSAEEIKGLSAKLAEAKPSSKSRMAAADFTGACGKFMEAANPLVADGKIEPAEVAPLRNAAEQLYEAFGVELE